MMMKVRVMVVKMRRVLMLKCVLVGDLNRNNRKVRRHRRPRIGIGIMKKNSKNFITKALLEATKKAPRPPHP